jgi:hypothetical protein
VRPPQVTAGRRDRLPHCLQLWFKRPFEGPPGAQLVTITAAVLSLVSAPHHVTGHERQQYFLNPGWQEDKQEKQSALPMSPGVNYDRLRDAPKAGTISAPIASYMWSAE